MHAHFCIMPREREQADHVLSPQAYPYRHSNAARYRHCPRIFRSLLCNADDRATALGGVVASQKSEMDDMNDVSGDFSEVTIGHLGTLPRLSNLCVAPSNAARPSPDATQRPGVGRWAGCSR
jgi:hypothetical protein